MTHRSRRHGWSAVGWVLLCVALSASAQTKPAPAVSASKLTFAGADYVHRWSKDGQNEFTPRNDGDLARWRDMVTINVNETVRDGEALAALANRVLSRYQSHGKIIRTDSRPRTRERPAEHLIVAVLGDPAFLEAAFARFVLVDDVGFVAVYSHRIYGKEAGPPMSAWLESNGPTTEKALMAWDGMPSLAALKQLPQNR